jgi:hypothetical protein
MTGTRRGGCAAEGAPGFLLGIIGDACYRCGHTVISDAQKAESPLDFMSAAPPIVCLLKCKKARGILWNFIGLPNVTSKFYASYSNPGWKGRKVLDVSSCTALLPDTLHSCKLLQETVSANYYRRFAMQVYSLKIEKPITKRLAYHI